MVTVSAQAPQSGARPDIFRAARDDDAAMLRAALAAGETLAQTEDGTGRTPLHVAVLYSSRNFLREAVKHQSADLWQNDYAGMKPADLCWLKNDFETHDLLQDAMYYEGWFLEALGLTSDDPGK